MNKLTARAVSARSRRPRFQTSDVREKLAADGAEPAGESPEALAAFLRQEIARWGKVIKAAQIEIQ